MNASSLCAYKIQAEGAYVIGIEWTKKKKKKKRGLEIVQLPLKMRSHEAVGKPPQTKGLTEGHNLKIS